MELLCAKPRIVVTTNLPDQIIDHLKEKCEIAFIWKEDSIIPSNDLEKAIIDCDGIFCVLSNKFHENLLDKAMNLKVISTMSTGIDHICLESCQKKGSFLLS
jgi:glyoxylate reductase